MRILQVVILLILSGCIQAQDVEFTAVASPDVLRVGEQFNLIYSSNVELEEFDLPDIRDFQFLGGPSQGHSQSVSSINGKITTTSTYQYTYFFRAVKEGKFTIPPAAITVRNKDYKSNAIQLEVIKSSAQNQPQNQPASDGGDRQNGQVGENDLLVRLVLDKNLAYLGEQILATVKIYTKTNLAGIDQGFKGPDYTGFFTEPIETPPLRNLQREVVDGEIYYTGVVRRMVIIPQKTGEIIIEPFDLDVALRKEVRRKFADPFFDDFSIPDVQEIPVKLKSRPVKVTVKQLPPGAPSSFKGAVGNFRISSSLSKTFATTGEPLTLKVALAGKGNLKLINEVEINLPYDLERYDPVINTQLDNPLSGIKTFEYLIMPKVAGQFTIPPVEFTYFDADAARYKTLLTPSYDIRVEKGQGDTLMALVPGMNKEDVKLLNQDIRFIKTKVYNPGLIGQYVALGPWYYILYALALFIFFGFLSIRRKMIRQNADIAGMRLRKADKYARKRLRKSEHLLKQGNDAAFYEEILGALWDYLSHKLNIPVASLSKDSVRSSMEGRGVDGELMDRLFNITNACEMARYGHGSGEIVKENLYHQALEVITDLQQKLK
jgi:hypothetical protein